jgi:hypothetical protein
MPAAVSVVPGIRARWLDKHDVSAISRGLCSILLNPCGIWIDVAQYTCRKEGGEEENWQ